MIPRRQAIRMALAGLAAAMARPAAAQRGGLDRAPVDLELILAADVSRSIDDAEYALQKSGYVQALTSGAVLRAIRSGEIGAIAIAYVEWSGFGEAKTVTDWTMIHDAGDAKEFTRAMLAAPRSFAAYTSISWGIDHSIALFGRNPYRGRRRVIDVSGDGANNQGRTVQSARDAAQAAGVVINGLPIINDRPNPFGRIEPPLEEYYTDNVICGEGAFVIRADDFQSFGNAVMAKLIKEIAMTPEDSRSSAA
jgi:hypothetical protein